MSHDICRLSVFILFVSFRFGLHTYIHFILASNCKIISLRKANSKGCLGSSSPEIYHCLGAAVRTVQVTARLLDLSLYYTLYLQTCNKVLKFMNAHY